MYTRILYLARNKSYTLSKYFLRMSDFSPKTICILGRQPKLGLAELESLYGAEHLRPLPGAALLDLPTSELNFKRLGGTLKMAQILTVLPTDKWQDILVYLIDNIPGHMRFQPEGKFTLGLSVYGLSVSPGDLNKGLMAIKRVIRSTGKSVRIVPNKSPALNTAQVLHNKLTTKGAWELMLVRDGHHTILAQSIFVQDIEAYSARDQARPARDARVGMLPPKLAQIMINLANPPSEETILDPFCGSGVVLQEALLIGYGVIGTDLEPRMVEFSKKNIDWLKTISPSISDIAQINQGDAINYRWPENISAVVSEIYLGKPLSKMPSSEELYKIAGEVNALLKMFLENLAGQINTGVRVCLAVPAWRTKSGFVNLPILDHLTDVGYNRIDFKKVKNSELIYFREDQIVARQLIVIEKK
jgi:tRNA G10  N-methylase Trm11